MGKTHCRRQPHDARRDEFIETWVVRAAAPCCDSDCARYGSCAHDSIPQKHPNVQFTIYSRTSIEVLDLLDNLEIDAGITYVENEPLGRVSMVPLYREHYRLLTSADAPLGNRDTVTWAEVAQVPLCLLTPDMQNRRIIDRLLKGAGGESRPTLESDSMILLYSHVRTGRWASVMPAKIADTLGLTDTIRAIPITQPKAVQTIGLVVPQREPMTPITAALVTEARRLAPQLSG
jgi:DNA-binding transcriptional LysR family regulator